MDIKKLKNTSNEDQMREALNRATPEINFALAQNTNITDDVFEQLAKKEIENVNLLLAMTQTLNLKRVSCLLEAGSFEQVIKMIVYSSMPLVLEQVLENYKNRTNRYWLEHFSIIKFGLTTKSFEILKNSTIKNTRDLMKLIHETA